MLTIIYSDEFLEHDNGPLHPERPERLRAIVEALRTAPWASRLDWQVPTPCATRDVLPLIQEIHSQEYVERVRQIASSGGGALDLDTPVSPRSFDLATLAVSAWLDGVDRVLETDYSAFVLTRPPGHHATKERGMGFCLFSNAAIAAHYALRKPKIQRVAILDWDVHHGNGTEAIVANNPQIVYCSLHQYPCYPGTGGKSNGNVLNLPMARGSTLTEYQPAFTEKVVPFLTDFQPDLLIVSAGYDANHDDPLASISLQPSDFGVFTDYCLQVKCPILFGLEGGYDLNSLARSVMATIETVLSYQLSVVIK
ncbi:MAG: histone deacetylase [Prochloron sp. SP5CPC1]|nr:histone deacetylase [Candidatus Paraprochloron terpiosi SP5CPC1]